MKKEILLAAILFAGPTSGIFGELTAIEKKYLAEFGEYTGGMGIGFDPSHTYDFEFRKAIMASKDEAVKRAFILERLPVKLEHLLAILRSNEIWISKIETRKMTDEERRGIVKKLHECVDPPVS